MKLGVYQPSYLCSIWVIYLFYAPISVLCNFLPFRFKKLLSFFSEISYTSVIILLVITQWLECGSLIYCNLKQQQQRIKVVIRLFQGPTIMRKLICIGFVVSQGATTRTLTNSSCNSISSKSNFKDEGETKLLLKEMSDNLISADLL